MDGCEVKGDNHEGELYEVEVSGTLIVFHDGKKATLNNYKAKLCRKHREMVLSTDLPAATVEVKP